MAKSPGIFAKCFAEGSESDEPEALQDDADCSDAELPHGTYDSQPSIRRLHTYDQLEAPSPQVFTPTPMDAQPGLSRLKMYDPFSLPPDLAAPACNADPTPASASTAPVSVVQGIGAPVAPHELPQLQAQQTPMLAQQHLQHQQPQQPQSWGMVQMMPMGCAMMPMSGGQVHHMQMQQNGMMPMMGMAMPASMVAGLPSGAVMVMPGAYTCGASSIAGAAGQPAATVAPQAAAVAASAGPVLPIAHAGRSIVASGGVLPTPIGQAQSGNCCQQLIPQFQHTLGPPPERAQPQTVTCSQEADGVLRVRWTVDARKLKGNDKTVVSPPFEIPSKATGTFKMMINPTPSKLKGGATFRNSNGRGSVQLKCDTASESRLRIRFSIGHGHEEPRGPLEHNFALNGVCGLPKEVAEWDFTRVVDEAAKTFVVCLEFL
mmetsp:Transcript_132597/g.383307  ORF Transcript_132597/g.383307 Transcript_132597/m.383307 type:complete len:431 (+) Transcript_132597:62-1354(+)